MPIEVVIRLIVAVARLLDVDPTDLAEKFNEDCECQDYYDVLLAASHLYSNSGEGTK